MINKVILVGNLGQDPEIRQTNSGTAVASMRMATSERRKKGDEWVEHTEWHNVVVFGRQAENCAQYLAKGSKVYVEGRLQTQKWEDDNGVAHYTTEIVASEVQFLDSRRKDDDSHENRREERPQHRNQKQSTMPRSQGNGGKTVSGKSGGRKGSTSHHSDAYQQQDDDDYSDSPFNR